ncbi:MAG: polysaccharide deacetylase family protein [Acidimicrobiia bacterium]
MRRGRGAMGRRCVVLVLSPLLVITSCGGAESSPTSSTVATTKTTAGTTTAPTVTTTSSTTTTRPPSTTTLPPPTTTPTPTTTPVSSPAETVWQVNTSQPVLALTFDAGSDRGSAKEILTLLDERQIKATFGMTGRWAETNPDLVLRMIAEGHALMNHTYDHPHMETLTTSERLDQLSMTETIIQELTGTTTKPYFRPPYGAYNNRVLADVGAAGYRYSVMWTVDSLGWKGLSPSEVAERCLNGAQPGAILLLHVGAASTDFEALPDILSGLTEAGYQFATIRELLP